MTVPGKRTVLVVDDEPLVREVLERHLKDSGYETAAAANGDEALVRASEQVFEVVLLDITMPGMSGIEALGQFRTFYPDVSVIMVTAVNDRKTAVEAMKLGAYDYVVKPFDLDDIVLRVKKARERRNLALELKNYQKNLEHKVAEQTKQLREMLAETVQSLVQQEVLERRMDLKDGKRKPAKGEPELRQFGNRVVRLLKSGGV